MSQDTRDHERQRFAQLSDLLQEQYALSRELYAISELQRRTLPGEMAALGEIEQFLEPSATRIRMVVNRLCALRDEIRDLYSIEERDASTH